MRSRGEDQQHHEHRQRRQPAALDGRDGGLGAVRYAALEHRGHMRPRGALRHAEPVRDLRVVEASTISSSTCRWRAVSRAMGAAGAPLETPLIATVRSAREQFFVRRACAPSCAAASASAGSARQHDDRHAGGRHLPQLGWQWRLEHDDVHAARQPRRNAPGLTLPDACAPAGEQGRERAHVQTVAPSYKQADACQTLVGFRADGDESSDPSIPEEAQTS